MNLRPSSLLLALIVLIGISGCRRSEAEIQRPERIVSKRQVIYDRETYHSLQDLWHSYYKAYPSEDAYANWMYAARYAGIEDYERLLQKGVRRYPANPTLLYLSSMLEHGRHNDLKGQHLLERAIELDSQYMDPWFSLIIHYMDRNVEKVDVALRRILESGAISEEIMDYSYNILSSLESDAILITNGDNDTYPGWILQRILDIRPDIAIVNRSLLNTDWYPLFTIQNGLPKYIRVTDLTEMRTRILEEMKMGKRTLHSSGPFSDTLITRIIESASRENRPVYLSATLFRSEVIDRFREQGLNLGMVTLVTPTDKPYPVHLRNMLNSWTETFRTGGLDSWQLRYSKMADSGRRLMNNYASSLLILTDSISVYTPEYHLKLFDWAQNHLMPVLSEKHSEDLINMWCRDPNNEKIRNWCRKQGFYE